MKSEQIMPSSGVVNVPRSPTIPLGASVSEIDVVMAGSVTANAPVKRSALLRWAILNRFAFAAVSVPTRTSTVRVPPA